MFYVIMSEDMDNFSEWLSKAMSDKGWSQADLARASGLTRQTISYYLGGKSKQPDEFALQQLAKAFGVDEKVVYRAAGILSSEPSADPWLDQQKYKLSKITDPILRESVARVINSLAEQEEAAEKAKLFKLKKAAK